MCRNITRHIDFECGQINTPTNITYLHVPLSTVEPLKTGTSVNRNSLETKQLARSQIFCFYLHCIQIPVNQYPSIPESGQAFYCFLMISTLFNHSKPNNICCHPNCFDNTCVDKITQGFHNSDQLWLHSDNDL